MRAGADRSRVQLGSARSTDVQLPDICSFLSGFVRAVSFEVDPKLQRPHRVRSSPLERIDRGLVPMHKLVVLAASTFALALPGLAPPAKAQSVAASAAPKAVTLPFEFVNQHIMLQVRVGESSPLWFILDTGDKFGVIDLELAKRLGLSLGGEVDIKGTSSESASGAFVIGTKYSLVGLANFSQPVVLAMPLQSLTPSLGHAFDGILGADFISQFVVEIDYVARTLQLHERDSFEYTGSGASLPIAFNSGGHPLLEAEIELAPEETFRGKFVLDIGAGKALILNSPFVSAHALPRPNTPSIRAIGSGGVGGRATGRAGRVAALKLGKFTLAGPPTFFSADSAGAHANADELGSIGTAAISRFKLFLDYKRKRILLEPNANFAKAFDQANSGLFVVAEGADFKSFRVREVLEDSPGSAAGLFAGDVIEAVDGRAAAEYTLTELLRSFELPKTCKLDVRRGEQVLALALTPRVLF